MQEVCEILLKKGKKRLYGQVADEPKEWAQPCVQISVTGILPYDIEKVFTQEPGVEDVEDEYDDDDDEEEIERVSYSLLLTF